MRNKNNPEKDYISLLFSLYCSIFYIPVPVSACQSVRQLPRHGKLKRFLIFISQHGDAALDLRLRVKRSLVHAYLELVAMFAITVRAITEYATLNHGMGNYTVADFACHIRFFNGLLI